MLAAMHTWGVGNLLCWSGHVGLVLPSEQLPAAVPGLADGGGPARARVRGARDLDISAVTCHTCRVAAAMQHARPGGAPSQRTVRNELRQISGTTHTPVVPESRRELVGRLHNCATCSRTKQDEADEQRGTVQPDAQCMHVLVPALACRCIPLEGARRGGLGCLMHLAAVRHWLP
jgi:hypothetical protein